MIACGEIAGDPASEPTSDLSDQQVKSPLGLASFSPSGLPVFDIQDSPQGRRYALTTRASQEEPDGPVLGWSGVEELSVRKLTPEEGSSLAEEKLQRDGVPRVRRTGTSSRIAPDLAQLAAARPNEISRVSISLVRPIEPGIQWEIDREVAAQQLATREDIAVRRLELLAVKQARIQQLVADVRADVENLGGTILLECKNLHCAGAELKNSSLAQLAQNPKIRRIEFDHPLRTNTNTSPTGIPMIQGTQLVQFIEPVSGWNVFDGQNVTSTRGYDAIEMAVIDSTGFDFDHRGFYEGSGTTSRIIDKRYCSYFGYPFYTYLCTSSTTTPSADHGTEMLGYAIGDLRDAQDSNVTTFTARRERSGYAGEALARTYHITSAANSALAAMDHIAGLSTPPTLLLLAIGWNSDASCNGTTSLAQGLNELYESGVLTVFAAGNDEGTSTNCTVDDPGSAIGALTVGAHGTFAYDDGTEANVRYSTIWDDPSGQGSAYGGNSTEGDGRTIIDFTAYGCRMYGFDRFGGYSKDTCGTSNAAAATSGALIDFVDYYINETWTTDIRNGCRYATCVVSV